MQNVLKKMKVVILGVLAISFLLAPVFVLADDAADLKKIESSEYGAGTVYNQSLLTKIGIANKDPLSLVQNIVRVILGFVGIVLFVLFFYAGFIWIKSRDNSAEVDKAKNIIESAIYGVVITMGAFAISEFVFSRLLQLQ